MLTDGELCELFTHGNSRAMQCLQRAETRRMIVEKEERNHRKRRKIYLALIFLSGSLLCISFGTMLGWPSPTYPTLLAEDSPIPITIDQSAMIAGMLMNGFVVSTPFAGCEFLGSKFGVLLGASIMLSGWLLMIGATDVLGLCISRFLVGIGAGFGIGKFKTYLKEICDEEDGNILQKLLLLLICFGIILSFAIGPFVPFRMLAIIFAVIPGLGFLTFIVVPDTPYNLFKQQKVATAVAVLQNFHGKECVDDQVDHIKNSLEGKLVNKSILQILRNRGTRKSFAILTFLMTIQQFSGGPSLIVYSQITYTEFGCFYPHVCSIVYAITFLLSTGIGIKYVPSFGRKPVMLFSCVGCAVTSGIHALYLYLEPENSYYTVIPFITMLIYCFFHTAGMSIVTSVVINDIFPTNARYTMSCYWNMYTAELAVIITKIFQVIFDRFGMYVAFCLYASVSTFGFFFILFFLCETKDKLERNILK